MTSNATVVLSRKEEVLCTLLDQACRWLTAEDPATEIEGRVQRFSEVRWSHAEKGALACEARIAGGWVRDKLLQRDSHDMDVSLSTLTGHSFALFLRSYLSSEAFHSSPLYGEMAACAAGAGGQGPTDAVNMSHIGKIAANPEQSKNLETATARVLGHDLDFVNLRKEVYDGDSRIPTMSFGTPLEDALRRDITINALFFNVHTRQVEDWTKHGVPDLQQGIVRTPLPPAATFTDDPLRILRCVRFASRFGYAVHPEIAACLQGTDANAADAPGVAAQLRSALGQKVSRERFGIEVDKMLQGPDPLRALQLLANLGIYNVVFDPPAPAELVATYDRQAVLGPACPHPVQPALATAVLLHEVVQAAKHGLDEHARHAELLSRLPHDWLEALVQRPEAAASQRYLWYGVALLPLRHLACTVGKKQLEWAGAFTIANGLKLGRREWKEPVAHLFEGGDLLSNPRLERFPDRNDPGQALLTPLSAVGLLLRHPSVTNPTLSLTLPATLMYALLTDLLPLWKQGDGVLALDPGTAAQVIDTYSTFWRTVQSWQLEQRSLDKPILDGGSVRDALQCAPPLISRVLPHVVAWQLDHAGAGSVDEQREQCRAWLVEAWNAGRLVPEAERKAPEPKKPRKK